VIQKLAIAGILVVTCFSQTAIIYELTPEDQKAGNALYEALEAAKENRDKVVAIEEAKVRKAQAAFDAWDRRESLKLRGVDPDAKDNPSLPGVEYSADFHLAVPKGGSASSIIRGSGIAPSGSIIGNNCVWQDSTGGMIVGPCK